MSKQNMYKWLTSFICLSLLSGCLKTPATVSHQQQNNLSTIPIKFKTIKFEDMNSVDKLNRFCDEILTKGKYHKDLIEQSGGEVTLDNFYKPLDALKIAVKNLSGKLSLIANAFTDKDLREVARNCEQKIATFETELQLSRAMFDKYTSLDLRGLDQETKYAIEKDIVALKHGGVDKDKNTREKLVELNKEITRVSQQFRKNVNEGTNFIKIKPEELAGVPKDYLDNRSPDENGFYEISTRYPDLIPIILYAEKDDVRKKLLTAFWQQAYPQNVNVVSELLQKRYEYAQVLGYENYAYYVLEEHMAKTPVKVQQFLTQLNRQTKPIEEKDYERLFNRLKQINPDALRVESWQRDYLDELVLKEDYGVDSQKVREYFSYKKTSQGILRLVQDLFDVEIKKWDTWVWDEKVEAFEVYEQGVPIGRFYLDMHPREGKYNHAAVFTVQSGILGKQMPLAAMLGNFPEGDEFLSHNMVVTYLHEFGHLMHEMFSSKKWSSTAGLKVERDFIEAPSQMLEEWVWNYAQLSQFATNNMGETLPKALFNKMKAARNFNIGMTTRRQLHYAALSLGVHNTNPAGLNVDSLSDKLQAEYTLFPADEDHYLYTSFGHFINYSATYYTYQWSLAIANDMFSKFALKGLMDSETARDYKLKVLSQGGAKPASELIEDFLGRPVSFKTYTDKLQRELALYE